MYKLSIPVFLSILLTACDGGSDGGSSGGSSSGGSSKPSTQNNIASTPELISVEVITPEISVVEANSTAVAEPEEFAYETQSSINISVSLELNSGSQQKQILFYETQKIDTSPVGDQLIFDDLLMEGVTDTNGDYTTKVTLGNHIESIWVVIPALSYENQVSIVDGVISVNIIEGL